MELPRPGVIVRWIAAACISGAGVYGLAQVLANEGNMVAAFAKSLFGVAAFLSGVILASPEVVLLAVAPIHRLLDTIFLPSESEPPPVDFTLARFYHQRMRYAEACEEYAKIVRHHPEQKLAYLEGIQAAAKAGDEEAAQRFYRAALRRMKTADDRALLEGVYAARQEPASLPDAEPGVALAREGGIKPR